MPKFATARHLQAAAAHIFYRRLTVMSDSRVTLRHCYMTGRSTPGTVTIEETQPIPEPSSIVLQLIGSVTWAACRLRHQVVNARDSIFELANDEPLSTRPIVNVSLAMGGSVVAAVQWHPESETASALDMQVFEHLLTAVVNEKQPVILPMRKAG
jgi:hypothetical protein